MAQLKYRIIKSTSDESKNLADALIYISIMDDSNWVAQNPKDEEIVTIKFEAPSQVKCINLKTIYCSGIVVSLYNLSQDNIKIQVKQLEKLKFLSQNHKARVINQDDFENYYEYADITFKSMQNRLSIGYILFYGTITPKQANQSQNKITINKLERPIQQFQFIKPSNSDNKLIIEPNNSALKIQPQISQRSAQIVNKAKQLSNQSNLFKNQNNSENKPNPFANLFNSLKKPIQNQFEDPQVKQAIEESLKTYKLENEKQSQKVSIEEEDLLEQIESFYDDDKLVNFANKAQEQNKTIDTELNNAFIEQKRFSQQKEQVKQFFQNKIQEEKIIITKINQDSEDLDLEQMTQYNEKMISPDFVQYHTILEDSFFRGTKLFDEMNKSFKPLAGHHIYINPRGLTEHDHRRLQIKAKNLGAFVEKQITELTSIIISDTHLQFADKNANILVLDQRFLESYPSDNFLKVEKYIIK